MNHNYSTLINSKFTIALDKKNIPVIEFMINENMINDFNYKSSDSQNILHILCNNLDKLSNKFITLKNVLTRSKSLINEQDISGNTPLINAVNTNNHDIATFLIENSANKNIKNTDGYYVNSANSENSLLFSFNSNGLESTEYPKSINSEIKNKQSVESVKSNNKDNNIKSDTFNTLVEQIEKINSELQDVDNKKTENVSAKIVETDQLIDVLVNSYLQNKNKQHGGRTIRGKRMLKLNNNINNVSDHADIAEFSSKKVNKSDPLKNYGHELQRLLNEQSSEIFERVVKKIMEMMKVDNETARVYKTALIFMVKRRNEKLTGLDLANEVEKLTTKDTLKKIDLQKERDIMARKKKEREEREERDKNKTSEFSLSSTSSFKNNSLDNNSDNNSDIF